MARKKSNNPAGRPSQGLAEARVLVPLPAGLLSAASEAARAAGVSRAAWIREAIRLRLAAKAESPG
jgi:nucleotidyltransferase/DNA polymerase involved in DNA repair